MQEYDPSDEKSILAYAKRLEGKKLGKIIDEREGIGGGKGGVGLIYEAYFGLKPSNESEPDFLAAGVELKIVPLMRGANGKLRVKERTSISMINYMKLVKETWEDASVRKKLRRILFIFFVYERGRPESEFITLKALLWSPDSWDERFFNKDWNAVYEKVMAGQAHEISEADGTYLGAARKGAGKGKDNQQQPFSQIKAPSRVFALKPAFTSIILRLSEGKEGFESLARNLEIDDPDHFEARILRQYEKYKGKRIGELARTFGIPKKAKNYCAMVIRRCLGAKSPNSKIEEFEKMGIAIKTVRLDGRGIPREAMSFHRFVHAELVREDWEESEFRSQTQRIFIVPLLSTGRKEMRKDILGKAFFWSPSEDELRIMRHEWAMYRDLIARGNADSLPQASKTMMVHVRPKARDSRDRERAPGGKRVVKKSFWFNKDLVRRIIERNG